MYTETAHNYEAYLISGFPRIFWMDSHISMTQGTNPAFILETENSELVRALYSCPLIADVTERQGVGYLIHMTNRTTKTSADTWMAIRHILNANFGLRIDYQHYEFLKTLNEEQLNALGIRKVIGEYQDFDGEENIAFLFKEFAENYPPAPKGSTESA